MARSLIPREKSSWQNWDFLRADLMTAQGCTSLEGSSHPESARGTDNRSGAGPGQQVLVRHRARGGCTHLLNPRGVSLSPLHRRDTLSRKKRPGNWARLVPEQRAVSRQGLCLHTGATSLLPSAGFPLEAQTVTRAPKSGWPHRSPNATAGRGRLGDTGTPFGDLGTVLAQTQGAASHKGPLLLRFYYRNCACKGCAQGEFNQGRGNFLKTKTREGGPCSAETLGAEQEQRGRKHSGWPRP